MIRALRQAGVCHRARSTRSIRMWQTWATPMTDWYHIRQIAGLRPSGVRRSCIR